MNFLIDVWQPAIQLPARVIQEAKSIKQTFTPGFDPDANVIGMGYVGMECVTAPGWCQWHTDEEFGDLTALWVVRNDLRSWVQSRGKKLQRDQPVGSMVLLNIKREHRLACPGGIRVAKKNPGMWVAAAVNFSVGEGDRDFWDGDVVHVEKRPTRQDVEGRFASLLSSPVGV